MYTIWFNLKSRVNVEKSRVHQASAYMTEMLNVVVAEKTKRRRCYALFPSSIISLTSQEVNSWRFCLTN